MIVKQEREREREREREKEREQTDDCRKHAPINIILIVIARVHARAY